MKEINKEKIEELVHEFLLAIGENPEREGLIETPERVARMCEEIFEGTKYTNDEIIQMFNKTFKHEGKDIIIMKEIPAFSYCEHHIALMYNMKVTVAYLPNGKIIGLSKIARIVDMVTKRLQLQEKIGKDIAYIISKICNTEDVAVHIKSEHACMSARGINKPGVYTNTYVMQGKFESDNKTREEFFNALK